VESRSCETRVRVKFGAIVNQELREEVDDATAKGVDDGGLTLSRV